MLILEANHIHPNFGGEAICFSYWGVNFHFPFIFIPYTTINFPYNLIEGFLFFLFPQRR